jgi:hypothetical protein
MCIFLHPQSFESLSSFEDQELRFAYIFQYIVGTNCNISISPGTPTASPFCKGGLGPPARRAYGSERGFF